MNLVNQLIQQTEQTIAIRLAALRCSLERDTEPEQWTDIELPAALLLGDVCCALGLSQSNLERILGQAATDVLPVALWESGTQPLAVLNTRQVAALACAEKHNYITLSIYRAICPLPLMSDETLRLDLVNLVERGLLTRSGRNKGTRYVLPAAQKWTDT